MEQSSPSRFFETLKATILSVLLFLFPLFFLTTTQEFYATSKLYLLGFGALLLLVILAVELLVIRKISWRRSPFDTPVFLLVLTTVLSVIIISPNKVQALLSPNFGLVMLLSLVVLYFFISRSVRAEKYDYLAVLNYSALAVSLITIVFFFQPLKGAALSTQWQFLQNPFFTPLGSRLDLAVFLGFALVLQIASLVLLRKSPQETQKTKITSAVAAASGILHTVAIAMVLYTIMKPPAGQIGLILPPAGVSWYAAVEILKSPLNALFGMGVDNFASIFTRVKDAGYNQSVLWQINSFTISRSGVLQILTETGVFGIIAFGLIVATLARLLFGKKEEEHHHKPLRKIFIAVAAYSLLVLLVFPPSITSFFLFFVTIAALAGALAPAHDEQSSTLDLTRLPPVYLGIAFLLLLATAFSGYLLGRTYAAEAAFRASLLGLLGNNAKELYDNQRRAVVLNPYIERFRVNFAQTNLLIANNIAQRAQAQAQAKREEEGTATGEQQPLQLSEEDRNTITQAVQAGIAEAKAAVALNPQKATNWENLGLIYRNILNAAEGADAWTVTSYQRAIALDPRNPIYYLNLGGVFYSLQNYDQAANLFLQSTQLKPDWANAHYNLAWASYQRGDYESAAAEMQNTLNLVDKNLNAEDYKRAQSELEEFKKKVAEAGKEGAAQEGAELNLPRRPTPELSPKIELPKEASPEAR